MMPASDRPVRIYKVGGSLFDWPELFEQLETLLKNELSQGLLVSGGGAAADVVREWDRVHRLGAQRAHRLAIQSLALGEAFLADGLHDAVRVHTRAEAAEAWEHGQIAVLDVASFLETETSAGAEPLPASWDVTSDSIAAWIASRWPATLVLLKSTSPQAAREPFVDRYFANFVKGVSQVEWINLRSGERAVLEPEQKKQ